MSPLISSTNSNALLYNIFYVLNYSFKGFSTDSHLKRTLEYEEEGVLGNLVLEMGDVYPTSNEPVEIGAPKSGKSSISFTELEYQTILLF